MFHVPALTSGQRFPVETEVIFPGGPGYTALPPGLGAWSGDKTNQSEHRATDGLKRASAAKPTGHVGTGAMVQAVLQQPLLSFGFGVRLPAPLWTVGGTVLYRVIVEFESFALRSVLTFIPPRTFRRWRRRNNYNKNHYNKQLYSI